MSKLLANQISNYNDNGPVEAKDGINVANGKPFQVAGASGTSGQFLKSTGSSVAWQDFPTIPAAQVNADWNATSGLAQISNKPTLHAVATSGQYSDLSGLPSIPAAQVQSDWNTSNSSSVSFIQNKPTLFSGAYNDLTGKPTIPSNLGDLANVASTAPNNNEVLKWNGSNWAPAVDATGAANTDTTYSQSSVASGSNVELRLTAGGSGSGDDNILVTAGNNITFSSVTAGGFTIASTDTNTFTGLTGTPSTYTANKWLKVNAGGTALEYTDAPSDNNTTYNQQLTVANATPATVQWDLVPSTGTADSITLTAGTNITFSAATADGVTVNAIPTYGTRTTYTATTSSIANNASDNISVVAFKSYALLKIKPSIAAWVVLYVDAASRTADASRTQGADPAPDAGVIAEVVTTAANQEIKMSPGVFGWHQDGGNDSVNTVFCKVVNKSGSTGTCTVSLTVVQLEA